jgi:SulP family sulfate permease
MLAEMRSGVFTTVNLCPIDVGYGLLAISFFGLGYAEQGIAAALLAVLIGNLLPALIGRSGILFAGARPAQTLLVVELIGMLALQDADLSFTTAFAYMVLCGVLAGVLQLVLGLIKAGNIVKYLPIPVLTGYLNAVALLIIWAGFLMMLGFPRGTAVATMLGEASKVTVLNLGFGVLLLALMGFFLLRLKRVHWSIAGLFGGTALYALVGMFADVSASATLPAIDSAIVDGALIGQVLRGDLPAGMLQMLRSVFPYATAIAILNSIESLLVAAKYEEIAGRRTDANRVLVEQGVANMVGGALGALPIAPSVSRFLIGWQLGGRGPAALISSALTCVALMTFGARFLALVPVTVVGALMAFLGWTMIDAWTHGQLRKLFALKSLEASLRQQVETNLLVMLVVIGVAISGHLIASMFVGALLAMFFFVRDYGRSVIGRTFSGEHRRSVVRRPEYESRYLESAGRSIEVLELNAPIVFGTAERLFDRLQKLRPEIRYLVLDFQRVRNVDDKGARILVRVAGQLKLAGIDMHMSCVEPEGPRGSVLKDAGLMKVLPLSHWHADTDGALESVENALLEAREGTHPWAVDLRDLDIAQGMSASELETLQSFLNVEHYPAGQPVFARGMAGDRLYILASGRVEIFLALDADGKNQRRIAAFSPGVVFGEMAIFTGVPRSADAQATRDSTVWALTDYQLKHMQAVAPLLASRLMFNIARQLSARLAVTNDELVYATRH